jgi:molybdopterin synthase catalytic subunit
LRALLEFALDGAPLEGRPGLTVPPESGGVVTFWGRVRNQNEGREVDGLEYEVYPELALKEGQRILAEAQQRYGVDAISACHRFGALGIGEAAVRVEVAAGHRGEAFEACRYVIDAIKARVPIWKRERYTDGSLAWVACHHPGHGHHA